MDANDIIINVQVNGANQLTALSNGLRTMNAALTGNIRSVKSMDAAADALGAALGHTSKDVHDHAKSLSQLLTNQSALSNEIRRAKTDYVNLSKGLAQTTTGVQISSKAMKDYAKTMKSVKARALVEDLRSLSTEMKRLGKDAQFTGRSMIIGITTPILTFTNMGMAAFVGFDAEMTRLNKLIDNMGSSFENAGKKMGASNEQIQNAIDLIGTLPQTLIESIQPGNEESVFGKYANETQRLAENMIKYRKEYNNVAAGITAISQKFGDSRELIASIAGDFAELGLNANESVLQLTYLAAAAEKLGGLDIGPSKDLLQAMYSQSITIIQENAMLRGELVNAIEAEAKAVDMARGQLYLFNAVENSTSLSLADIAQAFPEVGAAATQFGLSMTEAAALLAPMKAAGFEVGASANSIKVSLQRLNDPTLKTQERAKALTEALGYDFTAAAGIGITAIDLLTFGYNKLSQSSEFGKEGIQEFFNSLFESRQGPRMGVLIENLNLFNKEIQSTGSAAGRLVTKINSMQKANVPLVKSFSDLSVITRISAAKVGSYVQAIGEDGKTMMIRVDEASKRAAQETRDYIGKYIEDSRKQGDDLINQISSQAGRALVLQFAGPTSAKERALSELDTALNSIKSKLEKLRNNFRLIAADLIENLRPFFEFLEKMVASLTAAIQKMSPATKQLILFGAGMLAMLGPLVFAFGQAQLAVATLTNALLKPLTGLASLSYASLAASPQLLNLRKPIVLVNGALETSASRFSILIAKLASLNGPIGSATRAFGRLFGILNQDQTVGQGIMNSPAMIAAASLKPRAAKADIGGTLTSFAMMQNPNIAAKSYLSMQAGNAAYRARTLKSVDKFYNEILKAELKIKGMTMKSVAVNQAGALYNKKTNRVIFDAAQLDAFRLKATQDRADKLSALRKLQFKYLRELKILNLSEISGFSEADTEAYYRRKGAMISPGKTVGKAESLLAQKMALGGKKGITFDQGIPAFKGRELTPKLERMISVGGTRGLLAKAYLPFQNVGGQIGKGFNFLGQKLAGGAKFLGKNIFKGLSGVGSIAFTGLSSVSNQIGKGLNLASSKVFVGFSSLAQKASAGPSLVVKYFNLFHDKLFVQLNRIGPLLSRSFKSFPSLMSSGFSKMTSTIKMGTTSVSNQLTKLKNVFSSKWITVPGEDGRDWMVWTTFFDRMKMSISDGANKVRGSISSAFSRMGNFASTSASKMFSGVKYVFGRRWVDTVQPDGRIFSVWTNVFDRIGAQFAAGFNVLRNKSIAGFVKLNNAISSGFLAVENFFTKGSYVMINNKMAKISPFKQMILNMSADAKKLTSKIGDIGYSVGQSIGLFGRDLSAGFGKIAGKATGAMSKVKSAVLNPYSGGSMFINAAGIFDIGMNNLRKKILGSYVKNSLLISSGLDNFAKSVTNKISSLTSSIGPAFKRLKNFFATQYAASMVDDVGMVITTTTFFDRLKMSIANGFNSLKAKITIGAGLIRNAYIASNVKILQGFTAFKAVFALDKFQSIATIISAGYTKIAAAIAAGGSKIAAAQFIQNRMTNIRNLASNFTPANIVSNVKGLGGKIKSFDKSMRATKFAKQMVDKDGNLIPLPEGVKAGTKSQLIKQGLRQKPYQALRAVTGVTAVTSGVQGAKAGMAAAALANQSSGASAVSQKMLVAQKGLGGFIKGFKGAIGISKIFKGVMLGLGVTTIIIGIAAAVALVYNIFKNLGNKGSNVKDVLVRAFNAIKDAGEMMLKPIRDAIYTIVSLGQGEGGKGFESFAKKIEEIAVKIKDFVEKYVAPAIAFVMTKVVNIISGIVNIVKGVIEIFKGNWQSGLMMILKGTAKIFRAVISVLFKVADIFISIWLKAAEVTTDIFFGIGKGLVKIIAEAIKLIVRGITGLIGKIPGLGKAMGFVSDNVVGLVDDIANGMNSGLDSVGEFIKKGYGLAAGFGKSSLSSLEKFMIKGLDSFIGKAEQKLRDSTGKDLFPNGKAKEEGEETAEEFTDGFKGGMDGMEDAAKQAARDFGNKFVDLVLGYIEDSMQKAVDEMAKILERQKEAALGAFDAQLEALDALQKAEQSLTKEMQYQSDRRKMIQERELQMQNYLRNRALAIYEGRIDDARVLTLEEQKNVIEYQSNLAGLDESRRKDLADENLQAMRDSINKAKEEASKFFDEQLTKFKEAAEKITEFPPLTIGEYQEQINSLADVIRSISSENNSTLDTMLNDMVDKFETVIPNEGVPAFAFALDQIIAVAKEKYSFNPDGLGGIMVDVFSGENGINEQTRLRLSELTYDIFEQSLNELSDVIENNNPMEKFAEAIARANARLLYDMRKTMNSLRSAVGWLLPYLSEEVLTYAMMDALASNKPSGGGGGGPLPPQEMYGGYYAAWAGSGSKPTLITAPYSGTNFKAPGQQYGGRIKSFAMGGLNKSFIVPGYKSTPVPAVLHGGEYVVNSKAVQNIGYATLESLNKMKFSTPKNGADYSKYAGQTSSTNTTNIYVDNFIGQDEWFNQMVKDYNINVLPKNQKSTGLESRVIGSYNGLSRGG